MGLREKLAERMEHAPVFESATIDEALLQVSDHLIANGVTMQEWISVHDRLPDSFKPVIVCREKAKGELIVEQGHRDVNGWWKVYGTRTKNVTYWMPMPEPPKEG